MSSNPVLCLPAARNKTDVKECHLLASPALSPKATQPRKESPAIHLIFSPRFTLLRQINLMQGFWQASEKRYCVKKFELPPLSDRTDG